MNVYMIAKVVVQWGKVCGSKSYDGDYRLNFCLEKKFRDDFKEGGNGEFYLMTGSLCLTALSSHDL